MQLQLPSCPMHYSDAKEREDSAVPMIGLSPLREGQGKSLSTWIDACEGEVARWHVLSLGGQQQLPALSTCLLDLGM